MSLAPSIFGYSILIVSVATLNPFDLLNEEVKARQPVASKVSAPFAAVKKAAPAPVASNNTNTSNNNNKTAKKSNNSNVELNANVNEKTPLRRGSSNNSRRAPAAGNERQERRRTDRHSRTGFKQDGEKRMNGGKGSWGKAVEAGEEHVSVDESVAIAEQVGSMEISEEIVNDETVTAAAETTSHLTLAQYQATLKKPAVASTSAPRKVTTALPAAQIVKKESEVFVFPEIVKKSAAKKTLPAAAANETKTSVDVSKYISVKAVSSVEPRVERSESPRNNTRGNTRGGNNNGQRSSNNRESRPTSTSTKINLKDDRSFPTLGRN